MAHYHLCSVYNGYTTHITLFLQYCPFNTAQDGPLPPLQCIYIYIYTYIYICMCRLSKRRSVGSFPVLPLYCRVVPKLFVFPFSQTLLFVFAKVKQKCKVCIPCKISNLAFCENVSVPTLQLAPNTTSYYWGTKHVYLWDIPLEI